MPQWPKGHILRKAVAKVLIFSHIQKKADSQEPTFNFFYDFRNKIIRILVASDGIPAIRYSCIHGI